MSTKDQAARGKTVTSSQKTPPSPKGPPRAKKTPFEWTEAREQAAMDVARKEMTGDKIAARASVTVATLTRWKTDPEFAARVQEYREAIRSEILTSGIADVANRTARKTKHWLALQRLIDSRAEKAKKDPELQGVAGAADGLVVKRIKGIGKGEDFERVVEIAYDPAPLRELRDLEMDSARDLGQLTDKVEHTGTIGLVALDPNVAYGYPLGTVADIVEDFFALVKAGKDPVSHYIQETQQRIEQDAAAKAADAVAMGRPG